MPSNESKRYFVMDVKTGYIYGLKLDSEGNCQAIQPYANKVETFAGDRTLKRFAPLSDELPYGKTSFAIEVGNEEPPSHVFTIVWPAKNEIAQGALPVVTSKELPADLAKAGIAPAPKGAKNVKGGAVSDDEALKEALKAIDGMIGLDSAKKDIKQNIAVARFNRMKEELGLATKPISRHMVFTGNPGTGKTTFAREVAQVYHALGFIDKPEVHEVKREDLVAGFVGQTGIKTKEAIDKAKGGILFIDEAYALSRGGDGDSKDFGREAIDTLVAAMENMREDLIVIVAGYPEPMKRFIDANEGLKSRFMTYINFEDYSAMQLGQIMDVMMKDRGYTMEPDAREYAMQLIEKEMKRAPTDFGNGRTVRNLVEKAEKELAMRLETENKLTKNHGLTEEGIKQALTTITLADVLPVSLQGLPSKDKGIGFGGGANDNPKRPAPGAVETGARKSFNSARPGM